jgi:hypothetical protein
VVPATFQQTKRPKRTKPPVEVVRDETAPEQHRYLVWGPFRVGDAVEFVFARGEVIGKDEVAAIPSRHTVTFDFRGRMGHIFVSVDMIDT